MRVALCSNPYYVKEALFGIGLSYGLTSGIDCVSEMPQETEERLKKVALKLSWQEGGGHNKFLETITLSLDITAPRYWWQEFDTYRVGTTKQSESTIHTMTKRPFEALDFANDIPDVFVTELNNWRELYLKADEAKDIEQREYIFHMLKSMLPEGYNQRRIVTTNAKCLKNILAQRMHHRLAEWHLFRDYLLKDLLERPDGLFIANCIFEEVRDND